VAAAPMHLTSCDAQTLTASLLHLNVDPRILTCQHISLILPNESRKHTHDKNKMTQRRENDKKA